jgi:hypothetical protein
VTGPVPEVLDVELGMFVTLEGNETEQVAPLCPNRTVDEELVPARRFQVCSLEGLGFGDEELVPARRFQVCPL